MTLVTTKRMTPATLGKPGAVGSISVGTTAKVNGERPNHIYSAQVHLQGEFRGVP